jgi:hypothetical protein
VLLLSLGSVFINLTELELKDDRFVLVDVFYLASYLPIYLINILTYIPSM